MWFQTVDTTVRASLLQHVLSFSLAAAHLHGNVLCITQNKNNTGNCHTLQLVQRVECNLVGESRINQCGIRQHQWRSLYFRTHLCAFQYLITLNSQRSPHQILILLMFILHLNFRNVASETQKCSKRLWPMLVTKEIPLSSAVVLVLPVLSLPNILVKEQKMFIQIDMCLDHTGHMKRNRHAPFLRTSPTMNLIKIVNWVCSTSKSKERCQLNLAKRRQCAGVSGSSRATKTFERTPLIHEVSLVVAERRKEEHFPLSWNSPSDFWRPRWTSMTWMNENFCQWLCPCRLKRNIKTGISLNIAPTVYRGLVLGTISWLRFVIWC